MNVLCHRIRNAAFGASERDTKGDAEIDSVGVEMTEGNKVHPAEQEEETEVGGSPVANESSKGGQNDKNGEKSSKMQFK